MDSSRNQGHNNDNDNSDYDYDYDYDDKEEEEEEEEEEDDHDSGDDDNMQVSWHVFTIIVLLQASESLRELFPVIVVLNLILVTALSVAWMVN